MIIYGTRTTHLKSVILTENDCPQCGSHGTITMSAYARYVHIFWIPFISIGKIGLSQCQNCKQVLEKKQMPLEISAQYHRLAAQTKIPIFHFVGAFLLACVFMYGIYSSTKSGELQETYFKSPQKGDLYAMIMDDGNYTYFKIADVSQDSVWIIENNMAVNKATGLYKINKEENFLQEIVALPRTFLSDLKQNKKIHNIMRANP
jgi:hypothetical protein